MSTVEVLQKYSSFGWGKSKISRWLKQKYTILKNAACKAKNTFKARPTKTFNKLFKELRTLFLEAREKGHKLDFNSLWSKARIIYHRQLNDPSAAVRKHIVVNFIKRNDLKLHQVQRN